MCNEECPLVSVIIPTYKRSDTLIRAIESVFSQTYKNIELIVVDDNADFPEVRKENLRNISEYSKIVFIQNKTNLGGGLSRNAGIDAASGDYIAFLDDDDEYLPEKIEKQMNLILKKKENNVAVVYCYAEMINVDGTSYTYKNDIEGNALLENIEHCIAPTSFWLCDKNIIKSVGGFENISSRQDASLLMKLLISGFSVYRVPEILLKYYWHNSASGISGRSEKTVNAEIQYKNTFLDLANALKIDSKTVSEAQYLFSYRIAREFIAIGKRKDAYIELNKMLKIRKFDMKNLRVFFTAAFNNTYRLLSKIKNKKRVGN